MAPKRKSAAQAEMVVEVPKGKRGRKSQLTNKKDSSPAPSLEEEEHQVEEGKQEEEKPKKKRGRPSNKDKEEAAAKWMEMEQGKGKGRGKEKEIPKSKVEPKTTSKPSLPSLEQFLKDAEAIYINMNKDKNGEFNVHAKPKAFATGSYGWSGNANHDWYVGEDLLPISISTNITVQGSSSAPRENDTGNSSTRVGRKRKSDA